MYLNQIDTVLASLQMSCDFILV